MYFYDFLNPFGASPYASGLGRMSQPVGWPSNWYGPFSGLFGYMCNSYMNASANSMGRHLWWAGQEQPGYTPYSSTGYWPRYPRYARHAGQGCPQPATTSASMVPTASTVPNASTVPAASTEPAAFAPVNEEPAKPPVKKEGEWDADKGGYVLGASGQVQASIQSADRRSLVEYRQPGGEWTYLFRGQDDNDKVPTIKGEPGSVVEFRLGNNHSGEYFRLGTTKNIDNKDHAKIQTTGRGVRVGVDEWANDDGDFDDFVFNLNDTKAKG